MYGGTGAKLFAVAFAIMAGFLKLVWHSGLMPLFVLAILVAQEPFFGTHPRIFYGLGIAFFVLHWINKIRKLFGKGRQDAGQHGDIRI